MPTGPDESKPERARPAAAGVAAAFAAIAASELVAGLLPGVGSLFVAVGDRVIELAPGQLVTFAINTFGSANRTVLFVAMAVTVALAGAVVGVLAARRFWSTVILGYGAFAILAAAAGLSDAQIPAVGAIALSAVAAASGVVVLRMLLTVAGAPATSPAGEGAAAASDPSARGGWTRRAFLGAVGGVVAAAAVAGATSRLLLERTGQELTSLSTALPRPRREAPPPPPDLSEDVPGLSPLHTPNEDFYRIDTAFSIPRLEAADHRLRVTGMVARPLELTYDDILERVDREVDVTLSCVSNEVGDDLVGTARWLGFPLSGLLEEAEADEAADQVVGRAVDGWTAGFPTEVVHDGRDALVVVGMNGEPLPAVHGFPVRLVIAGLYGYISDTKWLTEIEMTTWDAYDGYWVPRGWAKEGPIKTQSRIDVPRHGTRLEAGRVAVAGVAWAGIRGIERVEVRVDDGPFQEAELSEALAEATWRQWVFRWDAEPGEHVLTVRATDGTGEPQTAERSPPEPDGATGHHMVGVSIT